MVEDFQVFFFNKKLAIFVEIAPWWIESFGSSLGYVKDANRQFASTKDDKKRVGKEAFPVLLSGPKS